MTLLQAPTASPIATGSHRDPAYGLLQEIWRAVGGEGPMPPIAFKGAGSLPSVFATSDLAVASIGAAALAVAQLAGSTSAPSVEVDRRLASLWFGKSFDEAGWSAPPVWDPVAGDYEGTDGWIRLHTNTPHHREAALAVLGVPADRGAVSAAVQRWRVDELEQAIVARGGCAASMRSMDEWAAHPQGRAVGAEPLLSLQPAGDASRKATSRPIDPCRPLAGVRVLDLTRIVAGPAATRFLAGFGADVLRVDPPVWEEPSRVPEMTIGKRCTRLDLRTPHGRETLLRLLADADIVVHGYRPGALERLGLGVDVLRAARSDLIEVSLNAYGWTGPWAQRRGYDSLVQMSVGIAHEGMRRSHGDKPMPLPVQALDHAAGYMMAAAAIRGLVRRRETGLGLVARVSLARTAALLVGARPLDGQPPLSELADDDFDPELERTAWGPARRLRAPLRIDGMTMRWDSPATTLGSSPAVWRS